MDLIYKIVEENSRNRESKIFILFDDIIADMLSNTLVNPMVTGFIIRRRTINISLVFITENYFGVSKNITLSSTHCFIMKI